MKEPEPLQSIIVETVRHHDQNIDKILHAPPTIGLASKLHGEKSKLIDQLLLTTFDHEPISIKYFLTRNRPHRKLFYNQLHEFNKESDWEYEIYSQSDFTIVYKHIDNIKVELCAMLYVETISIKDHSFFEIRIDIFDLHPDATYLIFSMQRIVTGLDLVDYPDARILEAMKFLPRSRKSIEQYARAESRARPFYVVVKSSFENASRRDLRRAFTRSLQIMGPVAEATFDWAEAYSGLRLPKDTACALAFRPRPIGEVQAKVLTCSDRAAAVGAINGLMPFIRSSTPIRPAWREEVDYLPPNLGRTAEDLLIALCGIVSVDPRNPTKAYVPDLNRELWDLDLESPAPEPAAIGSPQTEKHDAPAGSVADPKPERRSRGEPAVRMPPLDAEGYPLGLDGLEAWAKLSFGGRLVLAPRAAREARKVRHPNPARIARAIELLAGPRLEKFRGKRAAVSEVETALDALHLRDGFSNAERLVGRTGEDYVILHEGRRLLLDRHLASVSSGFNDPKMVRIYYAFDPEADCIVVGWLPTHLKTSQS